MAQLYEQFNLSMILFVLARIFFTLFCTEIFQIHPDRQVKHKQEVYNHSWNIGNLTSGTSKERRKRKFEIFGQLNYHYSETSKESIVWFVLLGGLEKVRILEIGISIKIFNNNSSPTSIGIFSAHWLDIWLYFCQK